MLKELNNELGMELNKVLNNAMWNDEASKEYETVFVRDNNTKYIYYKNTLIKCMYDRNGDRYFYETSVNELEQAIKSLRQNQLEIISNETDINVIKSSYDLYTKSITKAYKFLNEHKEEIIKKEQKAKLESLLKLKEESLKNLSAAIIGLKELDINEEWHIECNGEDVLNTIDSTNKGASHK